MPQKPKILNKTTVAKSRLFKIESLDLEFSNGEQRQYERLVRSHGTGAVLIVPLLDNDTFLLVREYAAGLHRYEIGFPKGKLDPGEDALTAANRELKEEIGYGANSLHYLTTLSLAPAYMEHSIDVVIAQDLYSEKLVGDEPEALDVIPCNIDDCMRLMRSDECSEARSIAAMYLALDYLNKG